MLKCMVMNAAENFVSVRLTTLNSLVELDFDIFVRLEKSKRHILYVKKGDIFDQEQITRLKSKKVRQLFIQLNDEPLYQDYLDKTLVTVASSKDAEAKAGMAAETSGRAIDGMMKNPTQQSAYDKTVIAAENMIKLVAKNTDVLKEMLGKEEGVHEDPLFQHAIQTAALGTSLAETLKMKPEEIRQIGTACMLLDLGRLKIPEEKQKLFLKPLSPMEKDDFNIYKEHPRMVIDMLQDKPYVSKAVLELIMTHEERKTGSGFPQGLKKLSPMMEVVGLCNYFCQRLVLHKENVSDILTDMMVSQLGNFDLKNLQALKGILKKQGLA